MVKYIFITYDNSGYLPLLNVVKHAVEAGAVKGRAAYSVVEIKPQINKAVFLRKAVQYPPLIGNAVAFPVGFVVP